MLKRLFGAQTPSVLMDHHERTEEALGLWHACDWGGLVALADDLPTDSAFALLLSVGMKAPLDTQFRSVPDGPAESRAYGAVLVMHAWRTRGFARGHEVTEDDWERCFDIVDMAVPALLTTVRADLQDGIALSFLVRAATMSNDLSLLREAGDLLRRADRRPFEGLAWLLQGWGRKWHGDHDQMQEIADEQAYADDAHPARLGVAVRALVERWLWDAEMADDPATQLRGRAIFALEETREWLDKTAADYERLMSVWPREEDDPYAERFFANQIGLAQYKTSRMDRARPHVEALGDRPSMWPWCYELGEPDRRWHTVRRRVGLR